MNQQRKLPSKRYSSYMPATDLAILEDSISALPSSSSHSEQDVVNMRKSSVPAPEKPSRRKSLNTLHFDALQNAVSQLSRIDDFDLEELGYGFFSDVFKVTHKQSGKIMVLKRNKDTNTKLNILREVQLMNRLSHPNILKFLGVCVHQGQLHGLTEFINGGDLDQLVQQKNTVYLSWVVRIRLALDVAKGLAYLHSLGIFHRDLTAKNCLVRVTTTIRQKKKYSAVVADLGLAEKIPNTPEQKAKLRTVGTPYCMAPEVLTNKPYDERSDIFSFGIIICQLIIRTTSDPDKLPRSDDFGVNKDIFNMLVKKGVGAPELATGTLPPSFPLDGFLQLAYDCCEIDPLKRPSIQDILCRLEQTLNVEKQRRLERKQLLSSAQDTTKRHSIPLVDLTDITGSGMLLSEAKSFPSHKGDAENSSPTKTSSVAVNILRSSVSDVSARLSRSSSDVSNELISHAVSIIASSREKFAMAGKEEYEDIMSVVDSLNEAFINPFTTLEKSELQEGKLFDLPSSEVMEMTFDLPSPQVSAGSPQHARRGHVRRIKRHPARDRPKSLFLDASESPQPLTPEPMSDIPKLSHTCENSNTDSNSDGATSPLPPTVPKTHNDITQDCVQPHHLKLKNALIRSVAFSPQGRGLFSWWHSHSRFSDVRSLASVLSIMTDKIGTLKKSISLPDLSQDTHSLLALSCKTPLNSSSSRSSVSDDKGSPRSSISGKTPSRAKIHPNVYPAYITLPRRKKSRCKLSIGDRTRKQRSKTSDDVFADESVLEILHEEATELKQNAVTISQHCDCSKPPISPRREINNNNKSRCIPKIRPSERLGGNGASTYAQEARKDFTSEESTSPYQVDGSVSSSSTSSGTSGSGYNVLLQTGKEKVELHPLLGPTSENPVPAYNNDSHPSSDVEEHPAPCVQPVVEDSYRVPKSNRDSGYNEDLFSIDHSCDSQSSLDTIDSDIRPSLSPTTSASYSPPSLNLPHDLPDYLGAIAPRCKIEGCSDSNANLVGKSH